MNGKLLKLEDIFAVAVKQVSVTAIISKNFEYKGIYHERTRCRDEDKACPKFQGVDSPPRLATVCTKNLRSGCQVAYLQ